jgi:hypothetical protein
LKKCRRITSIRLQVRTTSKQHFEVGATGAA